MVKEVYRNAPLGDGGGVAETRVTGHDAAWEIGNANWLEGDNLGVIKSIPFRVMSV